jgi:MoaA/NifB/PqqE/SkfB family radical SAM enzyme/predicted phosphodiesterase
MSENYPVLRQTGPLLIFGGPYSNLEATQALFAEAERRSIPPERMICTGDVVAYGADAAATSTLIRNSGCHVVMGNCEESLAAGSADCGCGFPDDSSCSRLSAAWFRHADQETSEDLRAWMAALPRRIDIEVAGARLAVVHGGATSINRFIFPSTPMAAKSDELDCLGVDGVIAGHSGIPFTQVIGGRLWHNSGAIGMPANDGTPRVWYSILDQDKAALSIEHLALEYDYRSAAEKMRAAGLPDGYADALGTGLWPSRDVLPFSEICERGIAIKAGSIEFQPRQEAKARGGRKLSKRISHQWPSDDRAARPRLSDKKFKDPMLTAAGEQRAQVELEALRTLWINTGTLCNITCRNCYIESSPKNDRLAYITTSEVAAYLDEIAEQGLATEEIGFTGGEPFMNPDIIAIIEDCLTRGFRVLVLTNGMHPMQRHKEALLRLKHQHHSRLALRMSLDHYSTERHEQERGPGTFSRALAGLKWLCENGFQVTLAGRTMWGEDPSTERDGYVRLLDQRGISLDLSTAHSLVLFPEMEAGKDVAEITTACWGILHKSPRDVMCASSRMVVKRKGAARPNVVACTLLPYDERFELGHSLREANRSVPLNHPFCAQFCVLGGASCSNA